MCENKFENSLVEQDIIDLKWQRIAQIRQIFCNDDNTQFAAKLGKDVTYTSQICNGSKSTGKKILEQILTAFPEVSRSWLYFGEGDMLVNSGEIRARDVGGDLLGHGATKVASSSDDVQKLVDIITAQQETIAKQSDQIGKLIEKLTSL